MRRLPEWGGGKRLSSDYGKNRRNPATGDMQVLSVQIVILLTHNLLDGYLATATSVRLAFAEGKAGRAAGARPTSFPVK